MLFLFVLVLNTAVARQKRYPWDHVAPIEDKWVLDQQRDVAMAERLAKSLTFQTISYERGKQNFPEFLKFHQYIRESFPLIHSSPAITLTVINGYSLLYKIEGSQPNATRPYMLAAHLDVVPVGDNWVHQPFGGDIVDNIIYGRGAFDDKNTVMGILEAVEFLLENNYEFQRTFFVGFGHDEEVDGFQGAGYIASHLKSTGFDKLDFILDEGSFVLDNIVQGIDQLVSMIAVTEKGFLTLALEVDGTPGHSSVPPRETAIGILARAVANLEETQQPSLFGSGPEMDFFQFLAPHVGFIRAIPFSNAHLLSPVIKFVMSLDPITDAIQRTTTAVTIFNAGYKANVIPGSASAVINHRLFPTDSVDNVLAHNRRIINDNRVKVNVKTYIPAVPVSPYGPAAPAFELIASSLKQVYPQSIITAGSSPGNTDLRQYIHLSDHLYRMNPNVINRETKGGLHGDDERISVQDYHKVVQVFVALITNADENLGQTRPNHFHRDL